MATTTATTAQGILREIGGAENITSMTHCATRLRFQVADQSAVDFDKLEEVPSVLGVVKQGTTGVQVIMGGGVDDYYLALTREPGMAGGGAAAAGAAKKKEYGGVRGKFSGVDYAFEFLSDTFRPILWALLGASLIITILVLLDTAGVQDFRQELSEQPPVFQFAHAMWKSVFYFLPIMVGATAAKKLGANEWVGAAIPAALFTPEFLGMREVAREVPTAVEGQYNYIVDILGIPMYIEDYGGQVFPPIFAAIILYFLEKGLKKIIPTSVHMVFVPFFSLLIMIPLTAFVVGPFGVGLGNGIAHFLGWVNGISPFILAVIIPLIYPFLVPLGLHWPLNAIMIVNINTLGFDYIQGPMGAWNFACFGVVAGVLVTSMREGNGPMRQLSFGSLMAGLLGGISEPSLYGILLRYRRSYVRLLAGCLVGGIIMGLFNIKAYAFVFTSALTVFAMDPLSGYVIGIVAAFTTSMVLVILFDYRTKEEKATVRAQLADAKTEGEALEAAADNVGADTASAEPARVVAGDANTESAQETQPAQAAAPAAGAAAGAASASPDANAQEKTDPEPSQRIGAPVAGRVVALADVPDEAFASGAVGRGVAVDPSSRHVLAPAAGKIVAAFPTGHAIGIKLDGGAQLLIHIGIDTVNMEGKGFELKVKKGDRVEAGDELVTFDRAAIEEAGYSPITPVLVTNHKKLGSVTALRESGEVDAGEELLEVTPR